MMENFDSVWAVVVGFVLRIGVPIALTWLFAWLLRRLDARWKAEAEERLSSEGAAAVARVETRCWEKRQCSSETREKCPAYAAQDTPCWQVFRRRDGRLPAPCFDCEVFRGFPMPAAG